MGKVQSPLTSVKEIASLNESDQERERVRCDPQPRV